MRPETPNTSPRPKSIIKLHENTKKHVAAPKICVFAANVWTEYVAQPKKYYKTTWKRNKKIHRNVQHLSFRCRRVTFFFWRIHLTWRILNFCCTSAAKRPSRSPNVTGLQRNRHFFHLLSDLNSRITFSMVSSLMTLKVTVRRTKIVHLRSRHKFGTMISNTWASGAPKSIIRKAKM